MNPEEDIEAFYAEEAEALRRKVAACTRCGPDGWCEPIGPCADGSYITSRACPNGCAGLLRTADQIEGKT